MSSRLDRLFILLDTGSSPVTRRAAALQLGEVQKLHPHELHNLLAKVHNYLHSSQWESRIAAGEAIEAIIRNVPQWDPPSIKSEKEMKEASLSMAGRLKFEQFDINKVLKNGSCLLASEGKEYEIEEPIGLEQKERLAKQRYLLNKRLGLDGAEKLGLDTSEIFSNDDLVIIAPPEKQNKNVQMEMNKKAIAEIVQAEMNALGPGLSSREINRAKRKAKLVAKQRSREASETSTTGMSNNKSDTDEPDQKKLRTSSIIVEKSSQDESVVVENIENSSLWEESGEWPFEYFCDQLSQDLFNHMWEIRHGAATALREIIRVHGKGAGKTIDMSKSQKEYYNQLWLEDIALRLLCALALDRFGDFISDQVVAPVRETCAQTLASALNIMNEESVRGVTRILLQLLKQPEWEARHGGLLGMKYLLAVRNDMISELLPLVFPPIFEGLKDVIDDVCAVAAAALVPISDYLIKDLPNEVPGIISTLWALLLEQDDLTTSTNSIMTLLASLLSHPVTSAHYSPICPLNELVPRLWPFLGHNSSSVRKSALQTLYTLTSKNCSESVESWITLILSDALRHTFQRCIFEHVYDVLELVFEVWKCLITHTPLSNLLSAACPMLSSWICLMMQPSQIPIPPEFLIEAKHKVKEKVLNKTRHASASDSNMKDVIERYYIGGVETLNDSPKEREHSVIRARFWAAKLIGFISCYISQPMPGFVYTEENESPTESYGKLLLFHLNSKSALQRMTLALLIMEWANQDPNCLCSMSVKKRLIECLNENIYYDEISILFTRLQQEWRDFISTLQQHNINIDTFKDLGAIVPVDQILELISPFHLVLQRMKLKPKVLEMLEERRKSLLNSASQTNYEQLNLHIAVQAAVASAVVALNFLPEKLNPVVKPLMDSVKKEEKELLQRMAATSLTRLLELCMTRSTCPNAKIIKNLCSFVTADANFTPKIQPTERLQSCTVTCKDNRQSLNSTPVMYDDAYLGIITLFNLQKHAEKTLSLKRSGSISKNRNLGVDVNVEDISTDDENNHQNELQRRGAQFALIEIAKKFGETLPDKLTKLWEAFMGPLTEIIKPDSFDPSEFNDNDTQVQELVNGLQVLEIVGPSLHFKLSKEIVDKKLPHLCLCLEHPYTAVRHMAARCIGMLSKTVTTDTMNTVLEIIVPSLESTDNDIRRLGSIETVANIIDCLGFDLVPYIVLMVIPVLGRMSDPNSQVRIMATHCFATLIRLMPLENANQDFISLNPKLIEKKNKERHFLEQLFDTKKLQNYKMPVSINAELRAYQQDGVNWLSFLNKYKLHGILCDDMGLGKTLQSICILAGDHYDRELEFKRTRSAEYSSLPSIVICPPTLTGHWVYEVGKFTSKKFLNPLHYTGPPAERQRLRSYFNKSKKHNLVIVSYDLVRNDIEFFGSLRWNYCILDEGHIIKNGKTKLSKAIKQLVANHRLILSGTPIQNNVLELWSLFDFLMPGFLGTEKQFTARYSKPILLSRDAKSSSKEQEAGALAMESLHRQVLPFLLRRMKEDVLQDLPPKIIQDYYCELSPLQEQLYEDFSKSRAKRSLEDKLSQEESFNSQSFSHIFQALQYLRKVCNHPKLVLNSSHPEFDNIGRKLKEQNSSLSDISHAAKLLALKQLLLDCGIGVDSSTSDSPESVVNQHRALIFCQLKSMLDILEKDLLKIHLPSVTYLRLDGSIPPGARYSVVHSFNNDPSIDVLLLTTRVGGLGLNLTGADTVIFVEHDWNPMKDLQAMDRAHRIGQKKVVNVYRLITKGTLEEKIMGLQKFKLTIANTVISQDNSSLLSMGTDQLLDLFTLDDNKKSGNTDKTKKVDNSKSGVKNVLESLPELWDEKQYEMEYDLSNFMQNLQKQ